MNKYLGYAGLALTLLTLLTGAAMAWQHLTDRVGDLERRDRYSNGSYRLPEGAK